MTWEPPPYCLCQVHGCESSLSLLEARKLTPIPGSHTGIHGLAKTVGHREVNKLAHTLGKQPWTPCTSRHDLCYKNATCSSGLDLQHCQILFNIWELLQYFILPNWYVSAWGAEKTGPGIYWSFNSLDLPLLPHLPQQLPPPFLPFCPETGTITYFRNTSWVATIWTAKGHDWICCCRQGEGGKKWGKKKKASTAMSTTRTGILEFHYSDCISC